MSYCVNCGVELEASCSICPLCHTKVVHPGKPDPGELPTPYPSQRGQTPPAQRSDAALLIGIVLAVTGIVCGLLNLLVFSGTAWSFYVIGGCAVLWVLFLPVFFPRLNFYVSLLLDGAGIAMYFGIIAYLHPGRGWYGAVALPLIVLATGLILLFAVSFRRFHVSILSSAALLLGEAAAFTIAVELLARLYAGQSLWLSWSAVVLTCCTIIDAALITIRRRSRLREEVRRRMHI